MRPTFPSPPLKFRTVGFPQYGLKAGVSDETFPAHWFVFVLRARCVHRDFLLCVRDDVAGEHLRASGFPLYPRGPRFGPGCAIPVHPHLTGPIRPTRGHIPTSPPSGLYEISSLCLIYTGLGDPRLVLSFH